MFQIQYGSWRYTSKPILPTYLTKNWPGYNKALKDCGFLTIWFNREVIIVSFVVWV